MSENRPAPHDSLLLGSDPACDLVLEDPSVAPRHARVYLDDTGHGWLEALDPAQGLEIGRGDAWANALRVTLCAGDRIRLGRVEVPLERLSAPFGARLALRPAPLPTNLTRPGEADPERLQHPVRNPVTGLIEDRDP